MADAVSQLHVCAARETLLDCFIQYKGCKVEQISSPFHLYLCLFFKFRRASVLFHANLACCTEYTEYGSGLLAKGYFSLNDFHAWGACKGQNSKE